MPGKVYLNIFITNKSFAQRKCGQGSRRQCFQLH